MAERDRGQDLASAYSEITTWLRALAAPLLAHPEDGDAEVRAGTAPAGRPVTPVDLRRPSQSWEPSEPWGSWEARDVVRAAPSRPAPEVAEAPPAPAAGVMRLAAERLSRGEAPSPGAGDRPARSAAAPTEDAAARQGPAVDAPSASRTVPGGIAGRRAGTAEVTVPAAIQAGTGAGAGAGRPQATAAAPPHPGAPAATPETDLPPDLIAADLVAAALAPLLPAPSTAAAAAEAFLAADAGDLGDAGPPAPPRLDVDGLDEGDIADLAARLALHLEEAAMDLGAIELEP